jgi:hypothetical protein
MNAKDETRIDPGHRRTQGFFRIVGPLVLGAGMAFTAVGMVSFFRSFGTFEFPRYFWCAFVGLPVCFVGLILCGLGYLGAFSRYMAEEAAPVQIDAFNVLAQGTRPGVETLAHAVGQGLATGAGFVSGVDRPVRCTRCDASNEASARFCSQCGDALERTP